MPTRAVLREVARAVFRADGTTQLVGRIVGVLISAGILAGLVGWLGGWRAAIPVFLLAVLAAAFGAAAFRLAAETERHRRAPRVYLRFTDCEIAPADVVLLARSPAAGGQIVARGTTPFMFARVGVANDPPLGAKGLVAEQVAARVEFLDADGTTLVSIAGRWAHTSQVGEKPGLGISVEGEETDLQSNGTRRPLDLAMRRPGEQQAFAYNDENAQDVGGLGPEKHLLTGERWRVQVTLRPANSDPVVGEFELALEGADSLTLTPVAEV